MSLDLVEYEMCETKKNPLCGWKLKSFTEFSPKKFKNRSVQANQIKYKWRNYNG